MQRGVDSGSDDAMNSGPPPRKEAVVENTTDSSIGSSAGLDAIQREARERLATKADDAEVPTYLWEEHLIDDSEGRFVPDHLPALRIVGGWLKLVMLCWWKNHVTHSFFEWLTIKHTSLRLHDKEAGS
eukprot:scaffold192997_cov28-Attheya_sp.AAC.1